MDTDNTKSVGKLYGILQTEIANQDHLSVQRYPIIMHIVKR